MNFISTQFEGLYLVEMSPLIDSRGIFIKPWISQEFEENFGQISEIYISTSRAGVFRGLHFQHGKAAQKKYVICLDGCIEDVALDLRRESMTYGKIFRRRLEGMGAVGVMVPEGFAHGIYAHKNSTMINFCNKPYSSEDEDGVSYKSFPELYDLDIKIISSKDASLKNFTDL